MKDTNNKQSASTLLISVKLKDDEQDYGQRVRSTITIETNNNAQEEAMVKRKDFPKGRYRQIKRSSKLSHARL